MKPYSDALLEYFNGPRNAGEVEQPTAVAEAVNPACGDVLRLSAKEQDGVLVQARFKAAGCVPALACGSWLAEYLEGKRLAELSPLAPATFEKALGGLPQASHHAAVLAADVMQRLLEALAKAAQ